MKTKIIAVLVATLAIVFVTTRIKKKEIKTEKLGI